MYSDTLTRALIYPDCVDTYNVNLGAARISKSKRFRGFLRLFAIATTMYFAMDWFWHGHRQRHRVSSIFVEAAFKGLVLIAGLYLFTRKRAAEYQILVDEEEISMKNFASNNRLFSRTVRRDQARTLIERKNGLLISRHGRLGTFFWGGVWVPKQLPDYEYLKRLASSWKGAALI